MPLFIYRACPWLRLVGVFWSLFFSASRSLGASAFLWGCVPCLFSFSLRPAFFRLCGVLPLLRSFGRCARPVVFRSLVRARLLVGCRLCPRSPVPSPVSFAAVVVSLRVLLLWFSWPGRLAPASSFFRPVPVPSVWCRRAGGRPVLGLVLGVLLLLPPGSVFRFCSLALLSRRPGPVVPGVLSASVAVSVPVWVGGGGFPPPVLCPSVRAGSRRSVPWGRPAFSRLASQYRPGARHQAVSPKEATPASGADSDGRPSWGDRYAASTARVALRPYATPQAPALRSSGPAPPGDAYNSTVATPALRRHCAP